MSKALTEYLGGAPLPAVSGDAMADAIAESAAEATTGAGGSVTYLAFSGKTGQYALGRNRDPMDPDVPYIMEPQSIIEGWLCWKGNKPVERVEWSIYERNQKAVPQSELDDHGPYRESMGEGWARLQGFGVIGTDAMHEPIKFTTTSISGRNAVSAFIEEVGNRARVDEPHIPVICFDAEEFEAQGQKNFKPVFSVEAWVTREAVEAYLSDGLSYDDLVAGKNPPKKRAPRKRK